MKMAQIGIRIPDEVKKRMEERKDINWSEFIRKKIIEEIEYPRTPRKIKKIVQDYHSDIYKLWILHMFSYNIDINEIYETAELIFGKEMDSEVDKVRADLNTLGTTKMYDKLDNGLYVGEAIRVEIENNGGVDIEGEIKERIKQLSDAIKKGIYLLSFYVLDDLDKDHTYIMPQGFEKTWMIYIGENVDTDDIFRSGILYKNYYYSRAYSHWFHIIHNYGLDILGELNKNPSDFEIHGVFSSEYSIKKMLEREDVKKFLRWMGGIRKHINTYQEEEEICKQLEEKGIELKMEDFKKVQNELVKEMILRFDFWPGRKRAGRRSSTPAYWVYKLDDRSLDYITDTLLKNL